MDIFTDIRQQDILMASFGKPTGEMDKARIRKVNDIFQLEYFVKNKAFHINLHPNDIIGQIKSLVTDTFKECIIYTDENDIVIFRNKKNDLRIKRHKPTKHVVNTTHNKSKNYLIKDGTDAKFLYDLGICDLNGVVTDKGSKKFIQINRFIQIFDHAFAKMQFNSNELKVVDFCCGKGYLTFALHHYLKNIKNLNTKVTGIDLKYDVIGDLNRISEKYEIKDLEFVSGDIKAYDEPLDIAIGLHACDVATDIFLSSAVRNKARLIISVPCCQHQLFKQISNEGLKPLLSYGLQKDRFTEMLTNTLRVLALKSKGYSVDLVEFAPIEHTMKNVLIRATYTGIKDKESVSEYYRLKTMFNILDFEGDTI
ncbi:MAG TPA: SAM-dependent methyltransferase [Clostridia bacterium]|jgi:SAM-dependent methyltransferase|nr:MAG: Methyltransferase TRM13 [Firmicutes bacterium ADurb.Bin146]HOD92454.1 SAM-dependent methyltransferase [Clostridia bacterium]HQM38811.1 SAM-dependent methyltransferase [Clostridia bacterium]